MNTAPTAEQWATDRVASVRDDPQARLTLLSDLYGSPAGQQTHPSFRRAAMAFMQWQVRRGVLNPTNSDGQPSGSPWWRDVNERLLRDTAEARAVVLGYGGTPSSPSARMSVDFLHHPSPASWYRAHNAGVVAAYLANEREAEAENPVERFFINLVLIRVLYAHALVRAPRLALGWCAPIGPTLGDPRLGMAGIFLSLSRVLPNRYPLHGRLHTYIEAEHGFGRFLDTGFIQPRIDALFSWSARELAEPRLESLARDGVPAYAWDPNDREPWNPPEGVPARLARRLVRPAR